jgi:hypothetical protein
LFDANARLQVRIAVGGDDLRFASAATQSGGSATYATVAREAMQRAAADPKLTVTETRGDDGRMFSLQIR